MYRGKRRIGILIAGSVLIGLLVVLALFSVDEIRTVATGDIEILSSDVVSSEIVSSDDNAYSAAMILKGDTLYICEGRSAFFDERNEVALLGEGIQIERILDVELGTSRNLEELRSYEGESIKNVLSQFFVIPRSYTSDDAGNLKVDHQGGTLLFLSDDGGLYWVFVENGIVEDIESFNFVQEGIMISRVFLVKRGTGLCD